MTRKDYNEFVKHIEKTKETLKCSLTPKPYKLCINKEFYNKMTLKQRIDFYEKNRKCIVTFFGEGIEVLQQDGSLIWFDGQIDDIRFVIDDQVMDEIAKINKNPTEENARSLKNVLDAFSKGYEELHGYTPTIHIDQYMACLSAEAFTVYQSIK